MITPITSRINTLKLPELDSAQAKKLEEVKQAAQQAIDTLKQSKVDVKAQRQSAAAERVARIKDAIKALKQMPGMDPKIAAKMIARLAKELASAIKEYKAAGGTDAAVGSGGAVTASSSGAEATEATEAIDPVMAAGTKAYAQAQKMGDDVGSGDRKQDDDDSFAKDASALLAEMRELLKKQKRKIEIKAIFEGRQAEMWDIKATEKALATAEKALSSL